MTAADVSRTVVQAVLAVEQSEGAGAKVRRSIGGGKLRNFTPFLMLDHFKVPKGAGFPDHPHRGQATVTYMLEGNFQHEDSVGHAGTIGPGDLQWMKAGRGIVHAEMPLHGPNQPLPTGLQLWVDLPEKNKNDAPTYQELLHKDIPVAHPSSEVEIKVIAGVAQGSSDEGIIRSPIRTDAGCEYYDIRLKSKGATVFQPIPSGWNAFAYTLTGRVSIGESIPQEPFYTVVLSALDGQCGVQITSLSDEEARLVLIAGEPLNQQIVQYGPFVLTNERDVRKAFMDYQMGVNGFENSRTWSSKIGASMR